MERLRKQEIVRQPPHKRYHHIFMMRKEGKRNFLEEASGEGQSRQERGKLVTGSNCKDCDE